MKLYKRLFTANEVKDNFGYNLLARVRQGGFATKEAAVEAWCDEAALSIHMLMMDNRGAAFAKNIYNINNEEIQNALKEAQLYEMLFIVQNGNLNETSARYEDRNHHSEQALSILYSNDILIVGY